MGQVSPFMGLRMWTNLEDDYDHAQLAGNFAKIDDHDHTPGRGVRLTGQSLENEAITHTQLLKEGVYEENMAKGEYGLAKGSFYIFREASFVANKTLSEEVLPFDKVLFDPSKWTNEKGEYVPQVNGYYRLTSFVASGYGETVAKNAIWRTWILKEGSQILAGTVYTGTGESEATADSYGTSLCTGVVQATAGQKFAVELSYSGASELKVNASAGGLYVYFCGELIGRS